MKLEAEREAAGGGGRDGEALASIAELSECLMAVGPAEVLEWPLVKLTASIEDVDTRELFEHLVSDHRGYNLRSILRFRELDPWVARTCTAHEAGLVRRQLQAWLEAVPVRSETRAARALQAWQKPIAEPELALLAERLLETLQHSRGADAPAPLLSRQRGLEIDAAQALVRAELCSDERQASQGRFGVFQCELSLQGFEHGRLRVKCACDSAGGDFHCCHVRALAERLLDVVHGPDTLVRRQLAAVSSTPSWVRFFRELGEPEVAEQPSEVAEQRLCYRLRVRADASVGVDVLLQRLKRGARYSRGARIAPEDVPDTLTTEPIDQLAVGLLRASASGADAARNASVALLRVLIGHACIVTAEDLSAINLVETRITLAFEEAQSPAAPTGVLRARARLGDVNLDQVSELPQGDHLARWTDGGKQLMFAPLPAALARWVWSLCHARTLLPRESHAQLRKRLRELQQHVQLDLPPQLLGDADTQARKLLVRLENNFSEGIRLSLHSRPIAGGPVFAPGEGPSEILGEEAGKPSYALRDLEWERRTLAELQRALQLEAAREIGPLRYNIEGREAALALLERIARAREVLSIEWLAGHKPLSLLSPIRRTDMKLKVGHAERWYEASGYAQLDANQQVSLVALLDAARTGQRYVQVGQDSYAALHDELRALLESAAQAMFTDKEKLKLSASVLPRLFELAELAQIERAPSIDALLVRMRDAATIHCEIPLTDQLRPYQREGVQFLLRLASWSSGGCLADEMGLGKTVQSLAVLLARATLGPALVIAPTSVGHNWCNEAARFAPSLDVRLYRGDRRSQLRKHLGPGSVLVTSYELATSDIEHLKQIEFATLVLDEAHMLKNAGTARARAIAALSAEFRIALTGTPLENHLGELWSLMAQLNPALLGSFTQFRAYFGLPIERYGDQDRLAVLRQLVSPFILRRDKRSVAPELPARIEATRIVPLSAAERELYDTAVLDLRRRIEERKKFDLDRVTILSEITRLRQLACHPALVVTDWQKPSSKLRALLEVLDDILPRGHRALLFSQFVSHLQLVRAALHARNLPYLYLDGSTKASERAELAERWQAGETSLFLISLKAGGTGLNLSKADYVIQLDPWWNPAAEDQAADRAHRIGSDRPVTILRLLAQSTVEEQVAALHTDKRNLAQNLLQETGASRLAFEELAEFLGLPRLTRRA